MFRLLRKRSVIDHKTLAAECMEMWRDTVAELAAIQDDCQSWLDSVPASLIDSATAEALRAVCALDLSELEIPDGPSGKAAAVSMHRIDNANAK